MKPNKCKVGLLNLQHSPNYGAVVQAYSLQKVVAELGYAVETIDFRPYRSILECRIKSIIKRVIYGKSVFEAFREKYLIRTSIVVDSGQVNSKKYSAVIVGSDQVWRPKFTNPKASIFFLPFCGQECKRIAYAASFGVDSWEWDYADEKTTNIYKDEVQGFNSVSVREESGLDICKNIFNTKATHVLDPTLLVGRELFEEVLVNESASNLQASDIVYYKLDADESFLNAVHNISHELDYSIESIYLEDSFLPIHIWLAKIRNSKLVITDSFHGVCLSILFNKEFICVVNEERGRSRLQSLLTSLGLEGRLVHDIKNVDVSVITKKIDYFTVNNILATARKESQEFLISSLNNNSSL